MARNSTLTKQIMEIEYITGAVGQRGCLLIDLRSHPSPFLPITLTSYFFCQYPLFIIVDTFCFTSYPHTIFNLHFGAPCQIQSSLHFNRIPSSIFASSLLVPAKHFQAHKTPLIMTMKTNHDICNTFFPGYLAAFCLFSCPSLLASSHFILFFL